MTVYRKCAFIAVFALALAAATAAPLLVPERSVSFVSNLVNTQFVFRVDETLATGALSVNARLQGPNAPQIQVEEVLVNSNGVISVRPNPSAVSPSSHTGPFSLLVATIAGLTAFAMRPRLSSAVLVIVFIGIALQVAQALDEFKPDWTLEVTISFPRNYELDSLSIDAARGSISGSGARARSMVVSLCSSSSNTVSLSNLIISSSGNICAGGALTMDGVTVGASAAVVAQSRTGAAAVTLQGSFTGAFNTSSSSGSAAVSLVNSCSLTGDYLQSKSGRCGSGSSSVTVIAALAATLSDGTTLVPPVTYRWSQAASWPSGALPVAGENVVIPTGKTMIIDVNTPELGVVDIQGTLTADPSTDFWLTAQNVRVSGSGAIKIGAPGVPFTRSGRFTLTGAKGTYASRSPLRGFSNDGISRSLRVDSGASLELYGQPPATTMTRLNEHAAAGATVLTVESSDGFAVGQTIVISCTTFPQSCQSDQRTITAVSGNQITINQGLSFPRWGRIQYATDSGLSLQPGTYSAMRAHPDVADRLDERAVIINLSRNIVIEGKNDTHWTNGHGVHVMWMGASTRVQLDGVEVRRAGQAGALGRYALHAHMQSYNMPNGPDLPSDGTFVGFASNVFVRRSSIHQSVNRGMVIHGTCGMKFHNNVLYDVLGHAIFLEDGSELMNEIVGNTVLNVRSPTSANALLNHDLGPQYSGQGAAGIWFSNPNNTLRDNIFGDIRNGPGMWNAFSRKPNPIPGTVVKPAAISISPSFDRINTVTETWTLTAVNSTVWTVVGSASGNRGFARTNITYSNAIISFTIAGTVTAGDVISIPVTQEYAGGCFGLSRRVRLFPFNTPTTVYTNNVGFSCRGPGALTDFFNIDEIGTTDSAQFIAFNDSLPGAEFNDPKQVPHIFDRMILWMNWEGAYRNRIRNPLYTRWIVADNYGTDLQGATSSGAVERGLFVGLSLNTLESRLNADDRHAFATYHHSIAFTNLTFYNYPPGASGPTAGYGLLNMPGVAESWDYYTSAVEMGTRKNSNWRTYNVSGFERTPPAHIEMDYPNNGGGPDSTNPLVPARRYWTLAGALYDNEGLLAGRHGDYLIFDHPFLDYELSNRRLIRPGSKTVATSDKFIGCAVWASDRAVDRYVYREAVTWVRLTPTFTDHAVWQIKAGYNSSFLGHFRHAAFKSGGRYRVYNQDFPSPNSQRIALSVDNGNLPDDSFILAVPWSGSVAPAVHVGSVISSSTYRASQFDISSGKARIYTESASRDALVQTPNSFWRDTATNQVWLHFRGGYTRHAAANAADQDLIIGITPA